jgi:hypothetical protein
MMMTSGMITAIINRYRRKDTAIILAYSLYSLIHEPREKVLRASLMETKVFTVSNLSILQDQVTSEHSP